MSDEAKRIAALGATGSCREAGTVASSIINNITLEGVFHMAKKNKQLVLAIFDTEAAADTAVTTVKSWDKASKDVKLGAIGVLVKDDKGEIKTHKMGSRKTGTGAVIGAVAAALATGGLSLIAGGVLGGLLGSFFHSGLGLSKEDLERLNGELDGGKAVVAILGEAEEADAISAKLSELGGVPEQHEVSDDAVEQAADAVEAAAETDPALPAPAA
jgi:hypothetical protein